MAQIEFPRYAKHNPAYWLNPATLWASRRKLLRRDNSTDWRRTYFSTSLRKYPDRSVPFSDVLADPTAVSRGFRILVLGDTGEGDWSQYGLVPLIRALGPDLMVINGDVAYPAGSETNFRDGFFRPYRDLRIPIWAVPGNHEYYSKDKGRTFHQIFCTERYSSWWSQHGLRLVPQPGTYWELKEPGDGPHLALIGIDSGMKGNLDGKGLGKAEDREQHEWLRSRLARCEAEGRAAIVLFHIPALVDDRAERIGLREVHQTLAQSPAVRLVVCGHIHNHQYYPASSFRRYLEAEQRVVPAQPATFPHFIVSGGGGAYLSEPKRKRDGYRANWVFPSRDQWRKHSRLVQWMASKVGLTKWAIGRVAGGLAAAQRTDQDFAQYLSLTLIDVKGTEGGIEVRHVLMEDLEDLFEHLPENMLVRVHDPKPPVDPKAVQEILDKEEVIRF